ncbi:FoF1 ATP synthase subunit delta/epsilon [Spiroplasma endosymbiont of Megaselia nigra]|uniref:FoF1 ATP synthase subunit delta/epsilon n=1 Tax=Spiroplasma endosymbiont of Megaselia nigra TaxID=2478537 RepID=UPI000F87623A|nr:F0F1 ATP synthase subunit epsilon [Spiroplasma endosymbiont of Megaselia nigra]RUO86807.1 F0F1 ATP synthase subunit epsilon [Spiroplasma endosymbiont of Megaselia nigra]
MANQISLKIITPQGVIVNRLVDIITVKTITGYMGILYGHIPLFSTIVPSEMTYKVNNKEYKLSIAGGILQVEQEFVKILADEVEPIS